MRNSTADKDAAAPLLCWWLCVVWSYLEVFLVVDAHDTAVGEAQGVVVVASEHILPHLDANFLIIIALGRQCAGLSTATNVEHAPLQFLQQFPMRVFQASSRPQETQSAGGQSIQRNTE